MTTLLAVYLETGLLLALGGLVLAALLRWGGGLVASAPRLWLKLGFGLLGLALSLPWLWRLGLSPARPAAVEVWSGPHPPIGAPRPPVAMAWTAPSTASGPGGLRLERTLLVAGLALLGAGGLVAAIRLARSRRRLVGLCRALPVVKRYGRVRLCAADRATAPYAARGAGLAFIVVPTGLLADSRRLQLVFDHEAEHHRRGDLIAAGLVGVLRVLFYWNPALVLWERAIAELQDLACDRRVLERRGIAPVEYGRCLLWAAEIAGGARYVLPGLRAMAASSAPSLRRRILMLTGTTRPAAPMIGAAVGLVAATLLLGTSWAVQGTIAERKMTRTELTSLAARVATRSGFPLLVDDRVVEAVNRRIATTESRDSARKALVRMRNYRPMIEDVFRRRGLPLELTAMALAESGFDNEARPDRPVERQAAGIWQFIPGTARRIGLQVSPVLDERLEPRRATEAAANLLLDLHRRFADWPLAIAAYNGGRNAVEALASGVSVTEARARVLASATEFGRYLPSVMASLVLLENPALVE